MASVGRNELCPCGSGKKYKKCHYLLIQPKVDLQLDAKRALAKKLQRQKQQGLGNPIISAEWQGKRFVAVGNRLHPIPKDQTFHNFLINYIKSDFIFGKAWFEKELAKPYDDKHPVVIWFEIVGKFMNQNKNTIGRINSAPMNGAMYAFLHLSYNLYLLQHNASIQRRLIERLRDKISFHGAKYETYVAAEFIKAGFQLELETNEEDGKSTHCEFTATSKFTGKKYSVEAKARIPNKKSIGVSDQLYKALIKEAKHERVIFIDHNSLGFTDNTPSITKEINERASNLLIKNLPAQPAYVFITNYPFEYDLEGFCEPRAGFACGFKITDFNFDFKFSNIREVLRARDKHRDMYELIKSMGRHEQIPATFDGEYPEFAFSNDEYKPRLLIGEKYVIPDSEGKDTEAVLVDAVVLEYEKKAYCTYKTFTNQHLICTNDLTDMEISAYKSNPDTFFGVPQENSKQIKDSMDYFDFLYDTYKNSTRDKLLEFLKGHPNYEKFKELNQEELAFSYCEAAVHSEVLAGRLLKSV